MVGLRNSRWRSRVRLAAFCSVLILPFAVILFLTPGCSSNKQAATGSQVSSVEPHPDFVGDEACAECHPNQSRKHRATRHARAMRIADREGLGDLAPPPGPIKNTNLSIKERGGKLEMELDGHPNLTRPLQFALGSGKSGMTYVSFNSPESLYELRMSYFPSTHTWYITPDQEENPEDDVGKIRDKVAAGQCILCHAVSLPRGKLMPEKRFFGVGCEACHGPGSAHIAAARTAPKGVKTDLKVEKIGSWNATRINDLCGKCHRSPKDVGTMGLEVTMTQRFQAYGLMQSPCFQKSNDTLSCLACHDPHTNATKDPQVYEKACLKCHAPIVAHDTGQNGDKPHAKTCPINPRDKCVGCHMPLRKVFPHSDVPIKMADHLIWAFRKKSDSATN
jgi:hypothetical protein